MTVFLQWFVATLLVAAAATKLQGTAGFASSLATIPWLRPRGAHVLTRMVPASEIVVAIGLVTVPRVGAGLALGLLLAFTAVLATELASGRSVACGCFGTLSAAPATRWTFARNGVLIFCAAAVLASPGTLLLPAALSGVGLAFAALVLSSTLSTVTPERRL